MPSMKHAPVDILYRLVTASRPCKVNLMAKRHCEGILAYWSKKLFAWV
jgi:hypothetical protein